jgi:aspartyl-tRNA(Asn)/glutamyl-tRNA(Gln) amidotransferase subunit C
MSLSLEQVRHVASLARLAFSEEEERRFQTQLSAILEAIEQLNALDTSAVEPTSHASLMEGLLREDRVSPSLKIEKVLANAPATEASSFAVPKIIE